MKNNIALSLAGPAIAVCVSLFGFVTETFGQERLSSHHSTAGSILKNGDCGSTPKNVITPCNYVDPIIMQFPIEPPGSLVTITCRNLSSPPAPGSIYHSDCAYFVCNKNGTCTSEPLEFNKFTRIRQVWEKRYPPEEHRVWNYYSGPHSDVDNGCCYCVMDTVPPVVE